MVGKSFTYLLGSDAAALLFNSKNEDLNAEDVYSRLTTPVFGKGVAYDVSNAVFLEQKKMQTGLNIAQFKQHVSVIEEETKEYFKAWGESGEKDLFKAFSELIILTASHCLHGEIRSLLNEKMAQLYADLDGGFSHAAWLLPGWLPLPSFRRRDRAHKIKSIFYKVIQKRRKSEEKEDDILQTLLDASYKDGRPLTDDEIAGMFIGLLRGQHTSSTTSAWLGFFIARDKSIQEQCYAEQKAVCGDDLPPLTYDQVSQGSSLLDRCLKETLRLRPPIMTIMRMARTPQTVAGYSIPPGHQVCVSPTRLTTDSEPPERCSRLQPDHLQDNPAAVEKFAYVPFGAGRHRCIGEHFAYVQIKTIWSTLLRLYEFDLIDDYFPTINYTTMIHTPNNPVIRYKRRSL
ncbi:LOW QUALITY PROTEIN: lanosterol 14-alpha demethylase [Cariama cristata]